MNISRLLEHRPKPVPWRGEAFTYAEQKMDGIRMTILRSAKGNLHAYGRKKYIDHWDRLKRVSSIAEFVHRMESGSAIDGELWVPGGTSTDVSSFLGRSDGLEFTPFYFPVWDGRDTSSMDADWHYMMIRDLGFQPPESYSSREFKSLLETADLPTLCKRHKIEGFVLKASAGAAWWKLKPTKTIDCIVMRWEEGVSRNEGRLGALVVGTVDHRVHDSLVIKELCNVGTGFTDKQRDEITDLGSFGRVVEIAYDCVAANGSLRFPRFVRFRDDKPQEECLGQELEQ